MILTTRTMQTGLMLRTMKLESVTPSEHKKGRFLLTLEDGTRLRVTEHEVLRFSLCSGRELTQGQLAELKRSAGLSDAKVQAANMVAARPLSQKELKNRLVRKGSDEEEADAAVAWLAELGAVNDATYAASLVRHYTARGYGMARIREELHRRGVPRELWDAALEECSDSGELLDTLIQKKCRGTLDDPKERKRVCDFLLRRGFSWSEVKAAMNRYTEILED